MLFKTHLMFGILAMLIGISFVTNKILFVILVLFFSVFPDFDSKYSKIGDRLIFRPIQLFVKHRGAFHSFSFAIVISILIAIFFPIASLGFFIGYSVHLICDSFTPEGIRPFWPLKIKSSGVITTGGSVEKLIFIFLIFFNLSLFFYLALKFFM